MFELVSVETFNENLINGKATVRIEAKHVSEKVKLSVMQQLVMKSQINGGKGEMQFKFPEIRKVKLPGKLYSVEVYGQITTKDIRAIEDKLRYEHKKSPFYSWFVAVSTTDSKTAYKHPEVTGKKGRAKSLVDGMHVPKHVHIGLIGSNGKSANSIAEKLKISVNKRAGRKKSKVVSKKGAYFISYAYQQSDSFHSGGDFDFKQCKDIYFTLLDD